MKNQFVHTDNVKAMFDLADLLETTDDKTPGLGLYYGDPGLGKTEAAQHLCIMKHEYVYIRAKTAWTIRWMLNDILAELNEQASGRTERAYERLRDSLLKHRRPIVIDEVDHMLHDGKVIETMRDIYDETGNPFLLIGMQDAERKLKRFPHLYSRFADVYKAKPISTQEILEVGNQLCDIPLTEAAAKLIFERTNGEFRKIMRHLKVLERRAQVNELEVITPQLLKA